MVGFFVTLLTLPWVSRSQPLFLPDESFTTVELKINFLRPVWKAELKAVATLVQRDRSIGYVECDLTDEQNRLIGKSSSTCMVLRGDKALGR